VDPTLYDTSSAGQLAQYAQTMWWIGLIVGILSIVGLWVVFTKAGEAGWKSIIPIYNTIIILKIVGRPWWWILLMLIPIVDFFVFVIVYLDMSKSFGHGIGFALGLIFLPFIFLLVLAFGSSKYVGPGGVSQQPLPAA
jgi:Family of unknown function (DUF5684)